MTSAAQGRCRPGRHIFEPFTPSDDLGGGAQLCECGKLLIDRTLGGGRVVETNDKFVPPVDNDKAPPAGGQRSTSARAGGTENPSVHMGARRANRAAEARSAATVSDFCECGHPRHLHVSFEREGACTGKRDTRPVTVGGPELTPCDCKQFKPLGWANVRV